MKKSCLLNFANGAWYPRGQDRLYQTVKSFNPEYDFDFLFIGNYSDINSPHHQEIHYAFKYYAFKHAVDLGYENIIWADCSMYAIKSIDPLFQHLDENGYFFVWSEYNNAQWTNDNMLKHFDISRDDAERTRHIYSGCYGINTHHPKFSEFFQEFGKAVPYFKGSWDNSGNTESIDPRCCGHRHDQSGLSLIANKLGLLDENGQFFQYRRGDGSYEEKTCLVTQGM